MKMQRIVGIIKHTSKNHLEPKIEISSFMLKNSGILLGDLKMINIKQIIALNDAKIIDFKSIFLSIIKD